MGNTQFEVLTFIYSSWCVRQNISVTVPYTSPSIYICRNIYIDIDIDVHIYIYKFLCPIIWLLVLIFVIISSED